VKPRKPSGSLRKPSAGACFEQTQKLVALEHGNLTVQSLGGAFRVLMDLRWRPDGRTGLDLHLPKPLLQRSDGGSQIIAPSGQATRKN
jgi:hypothetical protein